MAATKLDSFGGHRLHDDSLAWQVALNEACTNQKKLKSGEQNCCAIGHDILDFYVRELGAFEKGGGAIIPLLQL